MWLTGTISQVLLMYCSLPDSWLYDRVIVQFLGAAGTARIQGHGYGRTITPASEKVGLED